MLKQIKPIKDYEEYYAATTDGRIWSFRGKGRWLNGCPNSRGYKIVNLCKNKYVKGRTIHSLIAETFIPNAFNKPEVNHINGIKTDNRAENLEWNTRLENVKHSVDMGLRPSIKVTDPKTKIKYKSIREASRETGLSRSFINKNFISERKN
jgi:hypothetical protein